MENYDEILHYIRGIIGRLSNAENFNELDDFFYGIRSKIIDIKKELTLEAEKNGYIMKNGDLLSILNNFRYEKCFPWDVDKILWDLREKLKDETDKDSSFGDEVVCPDMMKELNEDFYEYIYFHYDDVSGIIKMFF